MQILSTRVFGEAAVAVQASRFLYSLTITASYYRVNIVSKYCIIIGLYDNIKAGSIGGMKLKSKLPALMKEKGVDQKTVAAATGLSPTTVGKLYRSHFDRIDNHTVIQLCRYFQIRNLDDLIEIVWEPEDEEIVGSFKKAA